MHNDLIYKPNFLKNIQFYIPNLYSFFFGKFGPRCKIFENLFNFKNIKNMPHSNLSFYFYFI